MELTTTLGNLVAMDQALDRLMSERWPIKAAYTLSKLSKTVRKEAAYAKQEQEKWIRELGTETKPTAEEQAHGASASYRVTTEHMPEFFKRLSELYAIAVKIDVTPISLTSCDGVAVSAVDVAVLADVITDD
jgi:hypothetical protein